MARILDTHIHLWPGTALSPANHGWMTDGHVLAKRHGIEEYLAATRAASSTAQPSGFVYVETDRHLPCLQPDILPQDSPDERLHKLEQWAKEPLEELRFLRRIVEGVPEHDDGFHPSDARRMVGCVIWAPFHLATELFDAYLRIAEDVAGPRLWDRVVGFRYLLQGIRDESSMRKVVESEDWAQNMLRLRMGRGGRGWAFDIGVDAHQGGVWQLEVAADMMQRIHALEGEEKGVKFVLNHLCKPDLSHSPTTSWPAFSAWKTALARMAALPGMYMKLSGGFNEFAPAATPSSVHELTARLGPFVECVFKLFGPARVMFGSDWPVCNVGGPHEEANWGLWKEVVERAVEGLTEEEREKVWLRAGSEAYGIVW